MKSKFAIRGHPLHAMLVVIPIGLFIWAFVSDIVYLSTDRDKLWYDISFWTGIAAIVSAGVAALPGIGDALTVVWKTDARPIVIAHAALNVVVVALFFVAMLLMLDDGATDGTRLGFVVALHGVGVGLLAISGWLGGELVYRDHIGMIPEDAEVERAEHRRHERAHVRG